MLVIFVYRCVLPLYHLSYSLAQVASNPVGASALAKIGGVPTGLSRAVSPPVSRVGGRQQQGAGHTSRAPGPKGFKKFCCSVRVRHHHY